MYKSNETKQTLPCYKKSENRKYVHLLLVQCSEVEALPLYITWCMSDVYFFASTDVPGSLKTHTPSHDTLGVLDKRLKPTFR